MKSVGEAMAFGSTFKEALQKGLRSLEQGRFGIGSDGKDVYEYAKLRSSKSSEAKKAIANKLKQPKPDNIFYIRYALQAGLTVEEIHDLTKIDPWFLKNIKEIVDFETTLRENYFVEA